MNLLDTTLKKLAKGTGISFGGKMTSTGMKYLTQVALASFLGAETFGLYSLGIVIYQLGELLARMGLESGAVRYISIHHSTGDKARLKGVLLQSLGLPFLSGVFLGSLLFLISDNIAQGIFGQPELTPILRLFAIALPLGASMTVGAFASTGFQLTKYKVYIRELLFPLFNLLLVIGFCVMGMQLWGATVAWLLSVGLALAATFYFLVSIFPEIVDTRLLPIFEIKQLLTFSIPLSFGSFLWLILLWTDILMLGYFRSAAEVGVYRVASQTALLMVLFSSSVITIFAPMIADFYSRGDFQQVSMLFQTAIRWSLSLTLPIFLILSVAGQDILTLFGKEFKAGWLPLVILAAGQLARAGAGGLAVQMLAMSGHQYLKLSGDLILAIFNIVLNMLLIPRWGLTGAAVATSLSIVAVNVIRVVQVYWVLPIQATRLCYWKTIAAAAGATLFGIGIHIFLSEEPFLLTASGTTVAILVVYAGLLWIMGLEAEDQRIVGKMVKHLGLKG